MKHLKTYENNIQPKIEYYVNGQKQSETYYLNGKYHRDNEPALQTWYNNGQKHIELYCINGEYHRENGPAYQYWYENGQKKFEYYFLNNIQYTREEWLQKLKKINSPHYQEQLLKYNAEKYNL